MRAGGNPRKARVRLLIAQTLAPSRSPRPQISLFVSAGASLRFITVISWKGIRDRLFIGGMTSRGPLVEKTFRSKGFWASSKTRVGLHGPRVVSNFMPGSPSHPDSDCESRDVGFRDGGVGPSLSLCSSSDPGFVGSSAGGGLLSGLVASGRSGS